MPSAVCHCSSGPGEARLDGQPTFLRSRAPRRAPPVPWDVHQMSAAADVAACFPNSSGATMLGWLPRSFPHQVTADGDPSESKIQDLWEMDVLLRSEQWSSRAGEEANQRSGQNCEPLRPKQKKGWTRAADSEVVAHEHDFDSRLICRCLHGYGLYPVITNVGSASHVHSPCQKISSKNSTTEQTSMGSFLCAAVDAEWGIWIYRCSHRGISPIRVQLWLWKFTKRLHSGMWSMNFAGRG